MNTRVDTTFCFSGYLQFHKDRESNGYYLILWTVLDDVVQR